MQVLIAEDDPISRKLLEVNLTRAGYEVIEAADGGQAWRALSTEGAPKLAVLDWMMPEMDGIEICRRVRADETMGYIYLILLTAKSRQEDRAEGFRAGADDYLTKPFEVQELRARVAAGQRIIELQCALEAKVTQLREALGHVKQLQGLLPICMYCKKIRDDEYTWHQLEAYIERHSDAAFTHSLCADCMKQHYPGLATTEKVQR
jgi:DNA-binding response OmpR family regulator